MSNPDVSQTGALDIHDVPDAHRYEARPTSAGTTAGETAVASYSLAGNVITFEHTKVPESMEGHHVGASLVKFALDDARARGLRVVARCPFVAAYIERHPEYTDLVR